MRKYQDYDNLATLWEKNGTAIKLYGIFRDRIKEEFHFDVIKEELSDMYYRYKEDGETDYLLNLGDVEAYDEDPCFGLYIGNCLNILPSGKYYMPFARSNVTDKEGLIDEIYQSALDDELEEHGLWRQSGEGDGLDVFFCKCFESES